MNILPFAGIAAIIFAKDKMGSHSNAYSDKWEKSVGRVNVIKKIGPIMAKIKGLEAVTFGSQKIINLTPHSVTIMVNGKKELIPRTNGFIRTSTKKDNSTLPSFGGLQVRMPVHTSLHIHFMEGRQSMGKFPPQHILDKDPFFNNVWFLVSRITANHMSDYDRILLVGQGGKERYIQDFLVEAQKICSDD